MNTRFREIDIESWERRTTYAGFRRSAFPFHVVGVDLELGSSVEFWKAQRVSPYLACIYVACRAANEIAAFRQRIRGDKVIELEQVHAAYTVPSGPESFSIRQAEYDPDFVRFKSAAETGSVADRSDPAESDHWVFLTCLPWVSFTHVMQPMKSVDDSVPRLAWGKFSLRNGVWQMPISVQAHHAIVDGVHIARLLERMTTYFRDPGATFGSVNAGSARHR